MVADNHDDVDAGKIFADDNRKSSILDHNTYRVSFDWDKYSPKSQSLRIRGFNILLAGFLVWAIVPTGMMVSRDIERTYSFSVSDVADETENIQNKAAEIEENDDSGRVR